MLIWIPKASHLGMARSTFSFFFLDFNVFGSKNRVYFGRDKDGVLESVRQIGERVSAGELIARVGGEDLEAPFDGVLRGLVHDGSQVRVGMKIGDLDPRGDPIYAQLVSDKSLAIGGAVLEAILTRPEIRRQLYAAD